MIRRRGPVPEGCWGPWRASRACRTPAWGDTPSCTNLSPPPAPAQTRPQHTSPGPDRDWSLHCVSLYHWDTDTIFNIDLINNFVNISESNQSPALMKTFYLPKRPPYGRVFWRQARQNIRHLQVTLQALSYQHPPHWDYPPRTTRHSPRYISDIIHHQTSVWSGIYFRRSPHWRVHQETSILT